MADNPSSGQIQEFLRVLRRRRWQIVMPAIYVLALGTVFAVLVPKKYVITTQVELLEGVPGGAESGLKTRAGSAVQREVQNVAQHLNNYSRIEAVVKEEQGLWPEYLTTDAAGRREVIERIRDNLDVTQIAKPRNEGSTFVDIEYRDVSGDRAVRFLEDLIDRWVSQVVDSERNSLEEKRSILVNLTDETLLEWRKSKKEFTDLCREMGVDPNLPLEGGGTNRQADPIYEALNFLTEQLQTVQTDLAAASEAYEVAKLLLEQAPLTTPIDLVTALHAQELQAEEAIAEIEFQRTGMTENNIKWQVAERQIQEIRHRIEMAKERMLQEQPFVPNPALPQLEENKLGAQVALAKLQAKENHLLEQLEDKEAERARRIDQMNELIDLKNRADERQDTYDQAYAQLRDTQFLLSQLEAYPNPYQIIRPPQVEGADTVPSALILVLMAAFGGLALGLMIAMAAEYAHNAYRTVADVAQVMAIPVLGTIDQIVTSVEARRVQARRTIVGLSSAVILGGLAWFTWVWAVSPNELPAQLREAIEQIRKFLM